MGTRSTIQFKEDNEVLVSIYQQYDGYIEGVGKEIKDFINSKTFVNGINKPKKQFNGFGCFIAQFIKHFKSEAGGLYIISKNSCSEEYNYIIESKDNKIIVSCLGDKNYYQEFNLKWKNK